MPNIIDNIAYISKAKAEFLEEARKWAKIIEELRKVGVKL